MLGNAGLIFITTFLLDHKFVAYQSMFLTDQELSLIYVLQGLSWSYCTKDWNNLIVITLHFLKCLCTSCVCVYNVCVCLQRVCACYGLNDYVS